MTEILQAARSYYGMDTTPVGKCEMYTNEHGSMRLVIEIPVTGDDFIAIGQRMKAMQEAESQQVEQAPVFGEDLETHAMRQQYNALSKAERGKYGSFGVYMTSMSNGIIEAQKEPKLPTVQGPAGQKVEHIDVEEEEPSGLLPPHAWMERKDLTKDQILFALGHNLVDGKYAIALDDLTEEQRQKAKEKP